MIFDEFERPRSWDRVDMANAVHLVVCPLGSSIQELAQLGERRSAEREVAGSNPGQTNTQGL